MAVDAVLDIYVSNYMLMRNPYDIKQFPSNISALCYNIPIQNLSHHKVCVVETM